MKLTKHEAVEVKGIIDILVENIRSVIRLDPVRDEVDETLRISFMEGLERVDKQFKPYVNVQLPSNAIRQMEMLSNYTFQNIQDTADEIGDALRQEMQRGLLNGDTKEQLIARVRATFKQKNYQARFRAIIRTETLRANNTAALEGARQVQDTTSIKLTKWLDVILDSVTSNICIAEHNKYGTPEEAIPLDQDFVVEADNKIIRSQHSPFHVNCRTVVRFHREGRT